MKKVLLLIISVLFAIQANAQTQEEAPAVTIDSLSTKLAELQHNYDFLYYTYQLHDVKTDFDQLRQDINIQITSLSVNISYGQYSRDLYTSHSRLYDSYCDAYDIRKRDFEFVQELIATIGFTEYELNFFNSYIKMTKHSMERVEQILKHYDARIKIYKDKRWRYSWE